MAREVTADDVRKIAGQLQLLKKMHRAQIRGLQDRVKSLENRVLHFERQSKALVASLGKMNGVKMPKLPSFK